ncbi:hypothetical protein M378DRAFT_170207 [Amanita muscaria Koide BX008]|uniref:Uncharacterized protein n=1 Tax=Amanita muscaria (strain Koide BX008) TaxID=946122 RepID=A0A0C2S7J3_AMAMK|nr:hypothetical protein M378DRAFT_170207 [Amanita muscaria Koide BX008]
MPTASQGSFRGVMVDFEIMEFREPDASFGEPLTQREYIDKVKALFLAKWLVTRMLRASIAMYSIAFTTR